MTQEVKHTPGPWIAEHGTGPTNKYATASTGVWSKPKFDVALELGDEDSDPMDPAWVCGIWGDLSPEDFANARLIAAAPDLLAALKALLEYSGIIEERCGDAETKAARAVIAKAEGRSVLSNGEG